MDGSPAVRVGDVTADAPFHYLRFREPPYDDEALARIAGDVARSLQDATSMPYFRHESRRRPATPAALLQLVPGRG